MKHNEFTPGQLVWITQRWDDGMYGYRPCRNGYPPRVELKPGSAATIIRKALAKDFGLYTRQSFEVGESTARSMAIASWLILYEGAPVLVYRETICKRRYSPRKTKQQV